MITKLIIIVFLFISNILHTNNNFINPWKILVEKNIIDNNISMENFQNIFDYIHHHYYSNLLEDILSMEDEKKFDYFLLILIQIEDHRTLFNDSNLNILINNFFTKPWDVIIAFFINFLEKSTITFHNKPLKYLLLYQLIHSHYFLNILWNNYIVIIDYFFKNFQNKNPSMYYELFIIILSNIPSTLLTLLINHIIEKFPCGEKLLTFLKNINEYQWLIDSKNIENIYGKIFILDKIVSYILYKKIFIINNTPINIYEKLTQLIIHQLIKSNNEKYFEKYFTKNFLSFILNYLFVVNYDEFSKLVYSIMNPYLTKNLLILYKNILLIPAKDFPDFIEKIMYLSLFLDMIIPHKKEIFINKLLAEKLNFTLWCDIIIQSENFMKNNDIFEILAINLIHNRNFNNQLKKQLNNKNHKDFNKLLLTQELIKKYQASH